MRPAAPQLRMAIAPPIMLASELDHGVLMLCNDLAGELNLDLQQFLQGPGGCRVVFRMPWALVSFHN